MNLVSSLRTSGGSHAFWVILGAMVLVLTMVCAGLSVYWWTAAPRSQSASETTAELESDRNEEDDEEWESFEIPELGVAFSMPEIPLARLVEETTPWGRTNWHLERLNIDMDHWLTIGVSSDFAGLEEEPLQRFLRLYVHNDAWEPLPAEGAPASSNRVHHRLGFARTPQRIDLSDDGRAAYVESVPREGSGWHETLRVVVVGDRVIYASAMGRNFLSDDPRVQRFLDGFQPLSTDAALPELSTHETE